MVRARKSITLLFAIVFLLCNILITGENVYSAGTTNDPDFDITKAFDKSTYTQGEKGILTYTIKPKGQLQSTKRPSADIVLALDISLSMKADKLNKMSKAAYDFIDKIQSANNNDRIALITFGYKVSYNPGFSANYSGMKNYIKNLQNKDLIEGTNYDAAMKASYSLLLSSTAKSKYVIFLSDGMPNYFTSDTMIWKYENIYKKYEGGKYYYSSITDYTPEAYSYATDDAKKLAKTMVTMYSIGLGKSNEIDMDFLTQLSALTGGEAYHSTIPDSLGSVFDVISSEIMENKLSNLVITETIPQGVTVLSSDSVIVNDNGTIQIRVPDISFKTNTPAPPQFTVRAEVVFNKDGQYSFNGGSIRYTNCSGTAVTKAINNVTIGVIPTALPPGLKVSKEISKTNLIEGETATLKYKLEPTGAFFDYASRKPLDIVLVIDRSKSMMDNSKLINAKSAAVSFINTFKQTKLGDRIGLVTFNKYSKVESDLTTDYDSLISKVNSITTDDGYSFDSGTNYEIGLRNAEKMLSPTLNPKYVIFLSDGKPNFYLDSFNTSSSYYSSHYNDYYDAVGKPYGQNKNWYIYLHSFSDYVDYFDGTAAAYDKYYNDYDLYSQSLGRGEFPYTGDRSYSDSRSEVQKMAGEEISLYTVSLGSGKDVDINFMSELASLGSGKAYSTQNASDLMSIFNNLASQISQQKISKITITEQLPDNITATVGNGAAVNGNTVTIKLPDICFEKGKGTPAPIYFEINLTFKKSGSYVLSPISKVEYEDWQGKPGAIDAINNVNVTVLPGITGAIYVETLQSNLPTGNVPVTIKRLSSGNYLTDGSSITNGSGQFKIEGLALEDYEVSLPLTWLQNSGYTIQSYIISRYDDIQAKWIDIAQGTSQSTNGLQKLTLSYDNPTLKIRYNLSGSALGNTNLKSGTGKYDTTVLRNGKFGGSIVFTLNQPVDGLEMTLTHNISTLSVSYVKLQVLGPDGKYIDYLDANGKPVLCRIDMSRNCIVFPAALPAGSYQAYFVFNVGRGVQITTDYTYTISVSKITLIKAGIRSDFNINTDLLRIKVVKSPKIV